MPFYESNGGRIEAVDTRPIPDVDQQHTPGHKAPVVSVKEAASHGTLDQLEEAICREAVGYNLEPYVDTLAMQGYRDIGGTGGMTPWAGAIDLPPETRRQEVNWARMLSVFSPPAKNALRLHRTYVLGQGIPMPTAPDSDVQEVIEDFWTDEANSELCSHQGQAETDASWITTGELFLALYVDTDDGHVKVRSVEPLDVDTVVTDPDDRRRILYYRVRQHRDTFDFGTGQAEDDITDGAEDEFVYFPDWQNTDPERDPYRGKATPKAPAGAVMASFPLNRQGVRGIPEFCAATPWIASHKRLIENQSIMSEARKRIALIKTVKGGPQAVGSSAALDASSLSAEMSRLERNPARAPGSTYVKNKGIELEYPDLSTGADDAQRDAELQAQMIGSAMGWGTHYLLMSTEFHRLATAVTMELPTLKMCLEGQQRWLDMLRSVIDFCLLYAAKAGTIKAPVVTKHGRELVDWKKAPPAPPTDSDADEDDQEKQGDDRLTVADAREMATVLAQQTGWYLDHADRKQAGGDPASAAEYRRQADRCVQRRASLETLVREMEPQDVLAQAQAHKDGDKPDAKAKHDQAKRGTYQCEMPPILERDLLPTIQAIEAAAGAGHITPEQAARQIMLVLGFGEVDDALDAWRSWVALKGSEIEKDVQQAQDLAHKGLAAKAGGPPGALPDAGTQAGALGQPKAPGSGQAPPSGGMSRSPVREGAETGPFDNGSVVREAAGAPHWVTIEEEGIQTHICLRGDVVIKGPRGLLGARAGHLPPGPHRTVTHHPVGHEPVGARDHPHYSEHQAPPKPEPKPGKPYARLSGAAQTRQEQSDQAPAALSKDDAEAGLKAAQEASRQPASGPSAAAIRPGGTMEAAKAVRAWQQHLNTLDDRGLEALQAQRVREVGAALREDGVSDDDALAALRHYPSWNDPGGTDPHQRIAEAMMNAWIDTGSKSPQNIALHELAADVFSLAPRTERPAYIPEDAWQQGHQLLADPAWQKAARAVLRHEYALTQRDLRAQGIKAVAIARGTVGLATPQMREQIAKAWRRGGDWSATGEAEVTMNALSSFSGRPETVTGFAGPDRGMPNFANGTEDPEYRINWVATVPTERILSRAGMGFGTAVEGEYVVLGGAATMGWCARGGYDFQALLAQLHAMQEGSAA